MLPRNIPPKIRHYSQKTAKLWVKHNGNPPTRVPVKGCNNLDDFAEKVKQKLNTNCPVALLTSLDKEVLDPGLKVTDLLQTEFKNNTSKTPLLVRIIPETQDSIVTKTIFMRDTDEGGELTDEYVKYKIKNKEDLQVTFKDGKGLINLNEPKNVIVNFDEVQDGQRYQNEAEALLEMKTYLLEKLQDSSTDVPTDIYDTGVTQVQEWDGAVLSGSRLYLLEAKHSMSKSKVEKLAKRIKAFPRTLEQSWPKRLGYQVQENCWGCTDFPEDIREEAKRLGLMVIYPSGRRYLVDSGKVDFDFTIER